MTEQNHNVKLPKGHTDQPVEQDQPDTLQQTEQPIPIEVKWNLPAWMLRHPGPRIEVEDDDVAFEEG